MRKNIGSLVLNSSILDTALINMQDSNKKECFQVVDGDKLHKAHILSVLVDDSQPLGEHNWIQVVSQTTQNQPTPSNNTNQQTDQINRFEKKQATNQQTINTHQQQSRQIN